MDVLVEPDVMTEEEASAAVARIVRVASRARTEIEAELVDCNRRKIWLALGMHSLKEFIESLKDRIELSAASAYRIVAAHEVTERVVSFSRENAVSDNSSTGLPTVENAIKHWPKRAIAQLAKLPEEQQHAAAERLMQVAAEKDFKGLAAVHNGRVKETDAIRVVEEFRTANVQKVASPPEGPRTFIDATPPKMEPRSMAQMNGHAPKRTGPTMAEALLEGEEAGTRENPYRTHLSSCEYDGIGAELLALVLFRGEFLLVQIPDALIPTDKERKE